MNFTEFQQKIRQILAVDLPSGESVIKQARSMAGDINIGRTAFMDKMGVDSELAYKQQCLEDNRIMFHAHIGMGSWEATADALAHLYKTAEQSEIIIDRAGICLDRRMGLPPSHRKKIPAETGPMLETAGQWAQLECPTGHAVLPLPVTEALRVPSADEIVEAQIYGRRSKHILNGRRILIASTDVHEHAIMIIHQLLAEAGADMINLGAEANPDQIVAEAQHSAAEAILISTHNGMALDYARRLKEYMDRRKITIPVVLGGILNQKVENQALPVDVSGDLKKLGFNPCPKLEGDFRKLLENNVNFTREKS